MQIENGLPEFCFALHDITNEVILVKRYETGYYRFYDGIYKGQEKVDSLNTDLRVTLEQAEAMKVGSMFGWHVPGANPERYKQYPASIQRRRTKP